MVFLALPMDSAESPAAGADGSKPAEGVRDLR
jgi:hypothetical protein